MTLESVAAKPLRDGRKRLLSPTATLGRRIHLLKGRKVNRDGADRSHRARPDGRRPGSRAAGARSLDRARAAPRYSLCALWARERGHAASRPLSERQGLFDLSSHRYLREDGRQAEPGAALRPLEVLDVARHRRGEEGRGRCRGVGRQYRRADGDGDLLPAPDGGRRPPGARRHLAQCPRREHRARCRCDDRGRRQAPHRSRRDGRRHGPHRVRRGQAARRAPQCRRRGDQGARAHPPGRAHAARGQPRRSRLCGLRRRRRCRARVRSMWW